MNKIKNLSRGPLVELTWNGHIEYVYHFEPIWTRKLIHLENVKPSYFCMFVLVLENRNDTLQF